MNKISRHKSPIEPPQPSKFTYSFQPALNQMNYKELPGSKSVNRGHMNLGGLGFLSLPKPPMVMMKQKTDLMPLNAYKY